MQNLLTILLTLFLLVSCGAKSAKNTDEIGKNDTAQISEGVYTDVNFSADSLRLSEASGGFRTASAEH